MKIDISFLAAFLLIGTDLLARATVQGVEPALVSTVIECGSAGVKLRAGNQRRGATETVCYEYFHGDNGAGIGASHQTGWTALIAKLIQQYAG
jgi:hypothetical protein